MDVPNEEGKLTKERKNNKTITWIYFFRQLFSCSSVLLHFFICGMYVGAPTVVIPQMRKEANSTDFISVDSASWISSTISFSGTPWVIILPVLSYRFGRKFCLILVSFSVIIGNLFFYFSTNVKELIIGLVAQGLLAGSILTTCPCVLNEYTSPKYRGVFVTLLCATLNWGIWISNIIGTFGHWKTIGIVIFVCSVYNLSTIFCCESPYWLAIRGNFDECAKVHRWLKGTDEDSEEELRKLILSRQDYINNKAKVENIKVKTFIMKLLSTISTKTFYKPFAFTVLLIFLYNTIGKVVCIVYAIDIIKQITSSEQAAYMSMLILDAVSVIGMYIGSAMSSIVTRRKQLLGFSSVGVIFLYILSIYLFAIKFKLVLQNTYISIFLLVGHSISVSCGPMILNATCSVELLPLKQRSFFLCCISLFDILFLGTFVKIAPLIFAKWDTPGAFLFFALSSSVFIIILYIYLPETKDKTIQEIEENTIRSNSCDRFEYLTETIPLKDQSFEISNSKINVL